MPRPTPYTRTRILDEVRAQGRTVRSVARDMGYSESMFWQVLRQQRAMSRAFVDAACRALGRPESALFFVDQDIPSPMPIEAEKEAASVA